MDPMGYDPHQTPNANRPGSRQRRVARRAGEVTHFPSGLWGAPTWEKQERMATKWGKTIVDLMVIMVIDGINGD